MTTEYSPKSEVPVASKTPEVAEPVMPPKDMSALDMSEEAYMASRDRLSSAIQDTDKILHDLRQFNKAHWVVRYPQSEHEQGDGKTPLSVLRLDLKLGATGSSHALVDSLGQSSVGQLLDDRMQRSISHLGNLRQRIMDKQSKVLVTGDLNAGKSTFVNALLRRGMVPTDQQPCTAAFCEVHDAERENEGIEEVHVLRTGVAYDAANKSTFVSRDIVDLEKVLLELEESNETAEDTPVIKIFCKDARSTQHSLLHNGAVDIALIDAPGLNRDSVKTTAVFAREEQIDVVVFVVSAENHFTLSAREFLQNASHDKAYVFVVVNKYDQIRNKDKCRRMVLEQLRELSPRTYEEAEELVHFVDAESICHNAAETADVPFERLENSLRDFVLARRAKSKLMPAQTYLLRLLGDVVFLAQLNAQAAKKDMEAAQAQLAKARPALAECEANSAKTHRLVESEEERVVNRSLDQTEAAMTAALDKIGRGESAHPSVALPAYPGLLRLWDYAQDVRYALADSLRAAVHDAEDAARDATTAAVKHIRELGDKHLSQEKTQQPKRVFVPEAMFSRERSAAAPGTMNFTGLGVSVDIVSVRLTDLFDVKHHFSVIVGHASRKDAKESEDERALVPGLSVGLGALTLVGSRSFGLKTAMDAFVRITDILGSRMVRRWAGPALLVVGAGLVAWLVIDLPNAVPRNVGRSLKYELVSGRALSDPGHGNSVMRTSSDVFSALHGARVARETRKVLRLASWDLQEKFRVAIAQRRSDVEKAEEQQKVATYALQWFNETDAKSSTLTSNVEQAIDLTA